MISGSRDNNYDKNAYDEQITKNINIALTAINNNKNIIICGPECSGKTFVRNKLKELLCDYDIYFGVDEYHSKNRSNGRHYNEKKFWIEEINQNLLVNIIEDYEFLNTPIQFNR